VKKEEYDIFLSMNCPVKNLIKKSDGKKS